MADDSDLEKTEPASPRRLDKAREEGQTPRSRELVSLLMLGAGAGGLWVGAPFLGEGLTRVLRHGLAFDSSVGRDPAVMLDAAVAQAWHAIVAVLPLFGLLAVMAIVGSVALGGLVIAGKPLQPDLARLNPIKGLARLVSAQVVVEGLKAIAKAALVGCVATWALYAVRDDILGLLHLPLPGALPQALLLVLASCGIVIGALVLVAGVDAPYQIWSHRRKLRMSRDDVRQESKESDGDPQLKARIRQQQRQLARGRMMAAVPSADVVITNPTHVAVALRYDETRGGAPRVVAKGAGFIAARIRELAVAHRVPLLEAPPLARALHRHVAVDAEIPAALYTAVAEVLAWVFQLRRSRSQGEVAPVAPSSLPVPGGLDPRPGTP